MIYDVFFSPPCEGGQGDVPPAWHHMKISACMASHVLRNIPLGTPCTPPSPRALGSPHEARIDI